MKTGAIIVADQAWQSGDMELFRPLADLEGTTVIQKAISTLRQVGISPIAVVTGARAEELERHISHRGTVCVYNPDYRENSIVGAMKVGLEAICEGCDQVLFFPVDAATFSVKTVECLLEVGGEAGMLIPYWEDRQGFPVLVRRSAMERLRELPAAIDRFVQVLECGIDTERIPVEDKGVVLRIRSDEEHETMQQYVKERRDANALRFDVKVFLTKETDFFGPGAAKFLLTVEEKGSMLAACQSMNMSYSKGWKMVKAIEDELGFPFLIRQTGGSSGGSSHLTEEGREFICRYLKWQQEVYRSTQELFEKYFSEY